MIVTDLPALLFRSSRTVRCCCTGRLSGLTAFSEGLSFRGTGLSVEETNLDFSFGMVYFNMCDKAFDAPDGLYCFFFPHERLH